MIYFDNAATTPIHPDVIQEMTDSMKEVYGNPSSTHSIGRKAKSKLESARKSIASLLGTDSSEIIFTSSGTEADNFVLFNAVANLGVKRIITSKIEHHAVLNTVLALAHQQNVRVDFVTVSSRGEVDLQHLEALLKNDESTTLVSLMYVNNEVGNILPVQKIAELCKSYKAYFHSDAVQAVGHLPINLSVIPIDFIVGSAHKFHGPKGVGFVYVRKGVIMKPMIYGGNQEKGYRSSTENIHSIIGMKKALELSLENIQEDTEYLKKLKNYCIDSLQKLDKEISFNGLSGNLDKSSHTILSIQLPKEYSMVLLQLDMKGIAVSEGSACQSGSNLGSHVLKEINGSESKKTSIRVSFSKYNTFEQVDFFISKLKELL